jgi:threonine synthase
VFAVQAEGCAPFDRAWSAIPNAESLDARLAMAEAQRAVLMTPWDDPHSAATGILDDVTYDWLGIARALMRTGGGSIVASEGDVEQANKRVRAGGYNADHTGTAGYAGLLAAVASGVIGPDDSAAVLVTGVRRD